MEHGDFLAVDHLKGGEPLSADAMLMAKRAWGIGHASSFLSIHSLGLQVSPKMQNVVASFIGVPGWFTKKMGTAKQGTQKIIQNTPNPSFRGPRNHFGRWFLPFFMCHPIPLVNSRILCGSFTIWNHFLKGLLVTQSNTWHTFAEKPTWESHLPSENDRGITPQFFRHFQMSYQICYTYVYIYIYPIEYPHYIPLGSPFSSEAPETPCRHPSLPQWCL